MKKALLLFSYMLVFMDFPIMPQYAFSHQQFAFFDAQRNNRAISAEIYYPALSYGESQPFATGTFPVIVFGHGYLMGYADYLYFTERMASQGYIVVYAMTATNLFPNHEDFGKDLAFLESIMKSEGTGPASFFYQHIAEKSAIMGHSMGGGASFIACENNTGPDCMVTFAAAETLPSSITAAQNVTIPSLVISGEEDCVAEPSVHQLPMYENLGSSCKVLISIRNGNHCNFADYNAACTFGESTCGSKYTFPQEEQHDVILDFVTLYLDYYLKNNNTSWTAFNDSLETSQRITFLRLCTPTRISEPTVNPSVLYPNPANDRILFLSGDAVDDIQIWDAGGHFVTEVNNATFIDTAPLKDGMYILLIKNGEVLIRQKLIVINR
jgi:dienelactone hydrolase